jgi:hypothetical protein
MRSAKWVDVNGIECEAPMYVETIEEALNYYDSIYDENQTNSLPPIIGLPGKLMQLHCYKLSDASARAGIRTKNELQERTRSSSWTLMKKWFQTKK